MGDASRLVASQYLLGGSFVPGAIANLEGFDAARPRLEPARRREAPDFPLAGKFSTTRVRRGPLAFAWAVAQCESDLSMESCLVALSTTRSEGQSRRDPHYGPIRVRQRGAIE